MDIDANSLTQIRRNLHHQDKESVPTILFPRAAGCYNRAMGRTAANGHQHIAEVRMPKTFWKRLRITAIENGTNASELMRRGARMALRHIEETGELPPER